MSQPSSYYRLVDRRSSPKNGKEARQRILQAAATGAAVDSADLATARGLTVREREDSILSDSWIICCSADSDRWFARQP